jgi:hypothetical protein
LLQKDTCGYAKVLKKRREEKSMKKWISVQENKTMSTLMPAQEEKKEMNKIAHVFFAKCSLIFRERYTFKEQY